MKDLEINSLDWQKMNGLLPAIIQNADNGKVLLLGYMNQESLIATLTTGQLTLYSRSRQRVWRKGESSGNSMVVQHISTDCDNDSLLIQVMPKGPACHLGYTSCYTPPYHSTLGFLDALMEQIELRSEVTSIQSQTAKLLNEGIEDCAQKMAEKAVATTIAATNHNREELIDQSSDLIYYLLVLFKVCDLSFYDVLQNLKVRDKATRT